MQADVQPFHDPQTGSYSYLLSDPQSRRAAIIDPVLHYDASSGRTSTTLADAILACVRERSLSVDWILETHAHADHLTAAAVLQARIGGRLGIGAGVVAVQANFRELLDLGADFAVDGSQFQRLFANGERIALGALEVAVLATPGHTSDSVTYLVEGAAFIGDTLFAPDYGTARCDFPGGDAGMLFDSVQRLYALPPDTLLYQCHDYPPATRQPRPACTVREHREHNAMLRADTRREDFIRARRARDATLAVPALLYPAIQVNLRAGSPPPAAASGRRYLKIPFDAN